MTAPSPAQLLADNLVLTAGQVATVLGLVHTRGSKAGQPNRHLVAELVADGRLTPVDPRQTLPRWTFATSAVRRYVDGTTAPATGAPALTLVTQESA